MRIHLIIFVILSVILASCGTKKSRKSGTPPTDTVEVGVDCESADQENCPGFIEFSDIDQPSRDKNRVGHEELPDIDIPSQSEDKPWMDYDPSQSDDWDSDFPVDERNSKLSIRKISSRWKQGDRLLESRKACLKFVKILKKNDLIMETETLKPSANETGLGDSVNCDIKLELNVPHGFQFAVMQLETTIRADILDSSNGYFSGAFGFDKDKPDYQFERTYLGGRLYHERDRLKILESQWSSCGGKQDLFVSFALGVNFKVLPNSKEKWEEAFQRKKDFGSEHGELQLGGLSTHNEIPLKLSWRRCDR
ncbi:MAG: DUF4360 domain-containing protein [Oligoflexus sp.]